MLAALYLGGFSQLFAAMCLVAVRKFGVERQSAPFDSTSLAVEGAYLSAPPVVEGVARTSPMGTRVSVGLTGSSL